MEAHYADRRTSFALMAMPGAPRNSRALAGDVIKTADGVVRDGEGRRRGGSGTLITVC